MNSKKIAIGAVMASLYVIATMANPISWGAIQFRISELLLVFPLFKKDTKIGMIVGVAVANYFSPLGFVDVLCGIITAVIFYYLIDKLKVNKYTKCIFYSVVCGVVIGAELAIVYSLPYIYTILTIIIPQAIITCLGVPICKKISQVLD